MRKSLFLALTATLLMVRFAVAQPEARFQVVQTGIDHLKSDLKYLVDLAPTAALKAQWPGLEGTLKSISEGIDPTKPIRVDLIFGKEVGYEYNLPIAKLEGRDSFIDNLSGIGFNVKKLGGGNLYSITDGAGGKKGVAAKKPIFMRYANGYASIAMTEAAVPAMMPHPIEDQAKGVKPLLAKGYDVVASMKNSAAVADIAARKANFQALRKQLEAGLVFKRSEDKNEFALRKLSLVQNLNEAERFVVETEELVAGWTTTAGTPGKGRGEFQITALPETDLFKSSALLAEKPSYFANVTINPKAVVSGRINFAIDPLRSEHLKDFYKIIRPIVEAQIDKRVTLKEAEQKKAAKQAAGVLIDMLSEGISLGTADLFLDLHPAGDGKHTLVCGVRAVDGKKADELVKLLPAVNAGREVKLDFQKIGDEVSLHSVAVPQRRQAAFQKLFPGETLIYVATSKDAVWGAAGTNAVAELEAAIKQAAEAAPEMVDPRVAYFSAHAGRMVELMDIVRPDVQKIDEKLSKDEQKIIKQRDKELEQIRKLAVDATADCEAIFSGEVKRNGKTVEGSLDVSECVLKFIGSVIADFAKNLK